MALETPLRFENCSSSHCLLSSWRRFHVFESSHPSFHRTVLFGAPLAFLRGVAMGLCPRCVILMSSCRRVFFPTLLTLLLCYPVTLLPCYSVILLPCFSVTLLPCNLVTLLPCYSVTLSLCYLVTLSPCYSVTWLPCYLVTLLPSYLVTLLVCYLVTMLCLVTLLF